MVKRTLCEEAVQALSGVSTVRLDLAWVTMVDAGGLGVMLALQEQAASKGMRFELMNLSKPIRRVFEITRLDSVFRITSAVEFFPESRAEPHASVARLGFVRLAP